jgi:hypothetical protein
VTTQTLTATALLEIDPTFKELLSLWWREKDIPVVLIDRLLDFDLHRQAECVRWMLSEPKRPNLNALRDTLPCPHSFVLAPDHRPFSWVVSDEVTEHCQLPETLFRDWAMFSWQDFRTPETAIAAALDAYTG